MLTRRAPAALVPAGAVAVALWLAIDAWRQVQIGVADAGLWFVVAATCVALMAAVAVGRWPERRWMALLMLWWLIAAVGDDVGGDWGGSRVAATAMTLAFALQAPAYAHMALAYPSGRVHERLERAVLVLAYAVSLAWMAVPALFADPRDCAGCEPHVPSLLYTGHTFDLHPIGNTFSALFIGLGLAFVALVVRRVRHSPPGARRTVVPLGAAVLFACAQLIVLRIAWLTHWSRAFGTLDWIGRVNLLVVPAAIAVGVATIRRHRGPLGDLVVELGAARPTEIGAALARAIGDPSLQLALWLSDEQQFVDENGSAVTLDRGSPDRAVTLIGPDRQPLAALVHNASLAGQRPLLEAAGSAARLALENARLHAQLRAQLTELQASRTRIVAAGDAERRRLERDLHDGAQQRPARPRPRAAAAARRPPRLAAARGRGGRAADGAARVARARTRDPPGDPHRPWADRRGREPGRSGSASDHRARRRRALPPTRRERRLLRRLRGARERHQARARAIRDRIDRTAERRARRRGQRRRLRRRQARGRERARRLGRPRRRA
jgi:hypothetical protein